MIFAPLGNQRFTLTDSAAKTLAQCDEALGNAANLGVPAGAVRMEYMVETNDIRITDNGTAPTSSAGCLRPKNTLYAYEGSLSAFQMIGTAAAVVWVQFYGERSSVR
jgi:hypothetical protein